jgi:hypothetical protein
MASGWAYVGGADFATGSGPTGSVQFRSEPGNQITGSARFMYYTGSYDRVQANTLVLTGTLDVIGVISASHYHIKDITEIDATGSTKFGDSADDTHVRTGSMYVYASRTDLEIPSLVVTASGDGTATRTGIGTAAPSGTLHVQTAEAGADAHAFYDDVVVAGTTATGITILTPGAGGDYHGYAMGIPGDSIAASFNLDNDNNVLNIGSGKAGVEFRIKSGNSVNALVLDANQNVTASAGDLLVTAGSITASANITASAFYGRTAELSGSDQDQLLKVYSKSKPYILFVTSSGEAADEVSITMGGGPPIADPTNGENNLLTVSGSISASVNVSASQFWGDGTNITNVGVISAVANGADNRVTTFSSADALNGEANLTFDGDLLTVDGDLTASAGVTASVFYGTQAQFSGSDQQQLLKVYSKARPYILFVTSSGAQADEISITMGGGAPQADVDGTNNLLTVSGSVSASVNVSASQFWGNGANLTGLNVFPFTGEAAITGSLHITGSDSGPLLEIFSDTVSDILTVSATQFSASVPVTASVYRGHSLAIGTDTVLGGTLSTVAGGTRNEATADYSVVVGGYDNTATDTYAFVGGGVQNNATEAYSAVVCGNGNDAGSNYSIIGAGNSSVIGAYASKSIIGSGEGNIVASDLGAIAGGYHNVIGHESFKVASRSFIGGGNSNTASAQDCVVVGGAGNHIAWGGHRAFIGGGQRNTASATLAAILGGSGSTVSANGSVAIGSGLLVASTNTIVLGGGTNDGGNHQYNIVAQGALSGTYGMEITGGVTRVSAFQGGYKRVTGGDGTMYPIAQESENIYIIGVSSSLTTNDVTVVLPSASIGAGHQIVIKDEWYGTRTAQYAITASVTSSAGGPGNGDMVEGDDHYYMYGSMASVTLYSDGVDKWFVV